MNAPYLRFRRLLAFFAAVSVIGELVVNASDLAPEVFAPGVISTDLDETSGSFSPDGDAFYFARWAPYTTVPAVSLICVSYLRNGQWTPAQVVPFSGTYAEGSPFIAPDGKRLYFASKRPTHPKTDTSDWNIWFVERQGNSWSEPQEIGPPVNTPHRESNPTVARDGTLYFVSDRDSQPGYTHIYRARLTNGRYDTPEKLGPEINGGEADTNPFISPDGKILIFASYSRKDTLRDGGNLYPRADLYLSVNRGGQWTPARHLEHGINSPASDGNPIISPDGKWFYFTSERSPFQVPMKRALTTNEWEKRRGEIENGGGNIYRISTDALDLDRNTSTAESDDKAMIQHEYSAWLDAYAKRDLARTMEIFAPDVLSTFPGSPDYDYTAIRRSYERSFANAWASRHWNPANEEIGISNNLAYILADWRLTEVAPDGSSSLRMTNRSMDVLRRDGDRWRIIRSFTIPADKRPAELSCHVKLPRISTDDFANDARELWRTLMHWQDAYNARDLAGTLAPFDPSITGLYAGNEEDTLGRLRDAYTASFAASETKRTIDLEPEEILISDKLAFIRDHWTSTARRGEEEKRSVSRGIEVWRRNSNGEWRLLHYLSYLVCK